MRKVIDMLSKMGKQIMIWNQELQNTQKTKKLDNEEVGQVLSFREVVISQLAWIIGNAKVTMKT